MAKKSASPFDTIESAHSFVQFLAATLSESKQELSAEVACQAGDPNRRRDALLVAMYNLERLEYHLTRSARLLNDLRSIRRLLLEERARGGAVATVPRESSVRESKAAPAKAQPIAAA
jgi:hypothetical protein